MRKTKIVCTIGPATDTPEMIGKLIQAGMNVARLNFSHETHEKHGKVMDMIKSEREKAGKPVAILLDTKGPEIRVGLFKEGKIIINTGDKFTLFHDETEGTEKGVSLTFSDLYKDVSEGTRILLDDGLLELKVDRVAGKDIECTVITGGKLSNNKGVNVPEIHLSMPYMSKKDREDILFGIRMDVDFIAASFVRTAEDVLEIRRLLDENGGEGIRIISKIENGEGVQNIDSIIRASSGIMVARGDMGVEIPFEEVPSIQKEIIKKTMLAGKSAITATQMLDSMMEHPRPTRAEVTDVANAVYDGTSAVMLSGETAAGKYPIEAVEAMHKICVRTEEDIDYRKRFFHLDRKANPDITDAISHATCTTALDLKASGIITVTKSGYSARMVSRYRPFCKIMGCTTGEKVYRQLSLLWGVQPLLISEKSDVQELFDHAVSECEKTGFLRKGETVVITAGVPLQISGTTNMIKVQAV